MISQRVSVEILVPLAVERLQQDPLAEGDYYPGDLLVSCSRAPDELWQRQPETADAMRRVLNAIDELPDDLRAEIDGFRDRLARR
jgi:hypothetical protein